MVIRREYHRAGREELRLAKRGGKGKTREMKTSLEHLPLGKRRELNHVLGVIKDEFRKAIANRRAKGVKTARFSRSSYTDHTRVVIGSRTRSVATSPTSIC
ncbi:hypothetical protein [Brevundimonas sp. BAL450]|uniref:hypothetical protein n=1 Tax=Brevundimonas sp. BAL450 TaxID=1708162 RepID=UPI001E657E49|nr:hypothetical protein [Brevundimonas sp. BAL450]